MIRSLFLGAALALALGAVAEAQVAQTGQVQVGTTVVSPTPTTQFNQACNGGAGGIVGQLGTGAPYLSTVCTAPTVPIVAPSGATIATNGTITTPSAFQSVLAASSARKGCLIVNTSANADTVSVGGSPSSANALPLAASGGKFYCSGPSGAVITDQINLASGSSGGTFVVWAQ